LLPMKLLTLLLAVSCVFAADPDLRVSEATAKKAAIEKPAPAYPIAARQLKVSGSVAVEAIVSESGSVEEVRTVSGNPILSKAVVEAVKKWRFQPFEAEGKKVKAIASLSFEFGAK